MKMTQDKEFTPITIVLETQFEAEVLRSVAGKISGTSRARRFADEIYDSLERCGIENDDDNKIFSGTLRAE